MGPNTIPIRVMIISDTHCAALRSSSDDLAFREGLPKVDILLHCRDLTEEGLLSESEDFLRMLSLIDAAMKLVIAGNHDLALDAEYYAKFEKEVHRDRYQANMSKEGKRLFKGREALRAGITYLDEGLHNFALQSGATFLIYASPFQPELCNWAFPYERKQDHWNPPSHKTKYAESSALNPIPDNVDIVMTRGPPLGHLDQIPNGAFLGCRHLQRAIARAKPRLHCFGHIHEGRGAERVVWSRTVPDWDTDSSVEQRITLTPTSSFSGRQEPTMIDATDLAYGEESLLVNAAIMDGRNEPMHAPWIVEMTLPLQRLT